MAGREKGRSRAVKNQPTDSIIESKTYKYIDLNNAMAKGETQSKPQTDGFSSPARR